MSSACGCAINNSKVMCECAPSVVGGNINPACIVCARACVHVCEAVRPTSPVLPRLVQLCNATCQRVGGCIMGRMSALQDVPTAAVFGGPVFSASQQRPSAGLACCAFCSAARQCFPGEARAHDPSSTCS